MATQLLSIGLPWLCKAGVAYALPAKLCRVSSTAAVTVSVDGATYVALTNAETVGAETSAVFLKAAADTTVSCDSW